MLAEHRAAQEKLQQRTNATSSGNSNSSGSNRDSSQDSSRGGGGNHADSKHRGSYEGKEGIPRGGGEHASSSKTLNLSSSSSHHHSQHHHSQHHSHHPDSKHHHSSSSSSSSLLSPYKSSSSQKSSTNTSASSSNNNNTKFPPSPHRHLLQQYPPYSGKDAQGSSKSLESSHQQALTRQSHSQSTVDSTGGKAHPAMFNTSSTGGNSSSSSQSALTSLQNFSNSKVPSSFGSIIHSADLDERKLKDSSGGNMLNNGRINGSFQSRLHSESAAGLELFNKRKDASLQQPQQHHHHHHHHGKGHNVRSPKRVRHLLTGSHGLAKEKLGEFWD